MGRYAGELTYYDHLFILPVEAVIPLGRVEHPPLKGRRTGYIALLGSGQCAHRRDEDLTSTLDDLPSLEATDRYNPSTG